MKIWPNLLQGSEQWHAARTGKLTASNASKIITAGGKPSGQREEYMIELISDCFAPGQNAFQGNYATDRGTALEPLARDAFRAHTRMTVDEVGFVTQEDGVIGCSPDGLITIGDGNLIAGLEIKCPQVDTHVEYLLDGVLPKIYVPQVHWSMAITGLPVWYFISYFPALNPLIVKVERDEYTDKIEAAAIEFAQKYAIEAPKIWDAILPNAEVARESGEKRS